MKKLTIGLAVALVAALAQASTVNWSLSGSVDGASAGNRVWCFLASDTSGSTAATKLLSQANAESLLASGDYATLKSYNTKAGTLTPALGFTSAATSDNASWGDGVSITGYAIIFDVADKNLDGLTKYMMTDLQTVNFTSAGDVSTFMAAPSGTWTNVPEPTSGLLMLLGIAGLALKRKRA